MNRRSFMNHLLVSLSAGFCAGLGATTYVTKASRSNGVLNPGSDETCLTPEFMARVASSSGSLPDSLTLTGSRLPKNAFLDLMAIEVKRTTNQQVYVYGGGCDDAVLAVRARKAHIGNLCCPIPGSPAHDMYWLPIAQDVKAVVVHPDNPVDNISLSDLQDVAKGRIRNWIELGGHDRPVALVVHDHCPTYFEPVRELLLAGIAPWSSVGINATTDEDHLQQIARFPTAIGVNSWVLVEPYVRQGRLKIVTLDGISPSPSNATAGAYPLTGPFNMIFSHWNESLMRPFFDYIFSEEGSKIISRMAVPIDRTKAINTGNAPDYARLA